MTEVLSEISLVVHLINLMKLSLCMSRGNFTLPVKWFTLLLITLGINYQS